MLCDMLDDVGNCVEACDIESLNCSSLEKLSAIKFSQGGISFSDHVLNHLYQLRLWKMLPFSEFLRTVTGIRHAADTGDDPLTDISVEVKDEIPDAVIGLVCPPPDVFFREFIETSLNPWKVFFQ